MPSQESGVKRAVEVMLNRSLTRLEKLKGVNKDALYEEYKEWIEIDGGKLKNDSVLYCNYLG